MTGEQRHVLIAGGGVAALEATLALRALPRGTCASSCSPPSRSSGTGRSRSRSRSASATSGISTSEISRQELGATFTLGELVSVDAARQLAYTSPGGPVPYSTLLVAVGTRPTPGVHGALTFRGPADTPVVSELLREIESGSVRHVVFAVPTGAVWSLPAYELALMTAAWVAEREIAGVQLAIVTPEPDRCELFGREASDAVEGCSPERGIGLHTGAMRPRREPASCCSSATRSSPADRVVALPRLEGPRIAGIPQTFEGFVPVDPHGRVTGMDGRLCRRRHHDISRQAGRHRSAAGRGRCGGDRRGCRRRH